VKIAGEEGLTGEWPASYIYAAMTWIFPKFGCDTTYGR
jgi:hypothetical protein